MNRSKSRSVKKKKKKLKLPPYVILKFDPPQWHVRRGFPTLQRTEKGKIIYDQITRRCLPETPEQAAILAAEIERQYFDAVPPPESGQTVAQFIKTFVAAKKGSVAIRTFDSYEWYCEKYIAPSNFGRLPINAITAAEVQNFYKEQATSGPMVRKLHNFLTMAFTYAVRRRAIDENPCKDKSLILPLAVDTEVEIMNKDEARAFMKTCLANPDYLILALALETGMRPGEYLALRWQDIGPHWIKVTRAVSFPPSGGFHYKSPKTKASKRTVLISQRLSDALGVHRARQIDQICQLEAIIAKPLLLRSKGANYERRLSQRKFARESIRLHAEHNLVFPNEKGTPISPRNLGVRTMTQACKDAGVGHHSLYSLRHSAITLLLPTTDIQTIAERHGTSAAMIHATYGHVLPSMRKDASERIAEALY